MNYIILISESNFLNLAIKSLPFCSDNSIDLFFKSIFNYKKEMVKSNINVLEKSIFSYPNFYTLFSEALKFVLNENLKFSILNSTLDVIAKIETNVLSKNDRIKWQNLCVFEIKNLTFK